MSSLPLPLSNETGFSRETASSNANGSASGVEALAAGIARAQGAVRALNGDAPRGAESNDALMELLSDLRKETCRASWSEPINETGRLHICRRGAFDLLVSPELVETASRLFADICSALSLNGVTFTFQPTGGFSVWAAFGEAPIALRISELVRAEHAEPTFINRFFNFLLDASPVCEVCAGELNIEVHADAGLIASYPLGSALTDDLSQQLLQTMRFVASLTARYRKNRHERPVFTDRATAVVHQLDRDANEQLPWTPEVLEETVETLRHLAVLLESMTSVKRRTEPTHNRRFGRRPRGL